MMRSSVVVGLVLVVGGCVAGVGDEATSSTEQAAKSPCPEWGCGANSPLMGPFDVPEASADHIPNPNGLTLVGLVAGTAMFDVDVIGDRLTGRRIINGQLQVIQGFALRGAYLLFTYPKTATLAAGTARLWINKVSKSLLFWQAPTSLVESYELLYDGAGNTGDPKPVCNSPLAGVGTGATDPEGQFWGTRFDSIIYEGDRYDGVSKKIIATGANIPGNWFNIACAGSAPAKLHLNRHTFISATSSIQPTVGERQAMLKMYSGDFCGSGNAYTKQGTPIHWSSAWGLASPPMSNLSYESMWTESGAVCLDVHRLASSLDPVEASFGAMVRAECNPPPCSRVPGFPDPKLAGAYLLTQSPAKAQP